MSGRGLVVAAPQWRAIIHVIRPLLLAGQEGGHSGRGWEGKGHKHERALTECPARPGRAERGAQPERLRAAAFAGGGDPRPAAADAVDGWRDADRGLGSGPREIDASKRQSSAWRCAIPLTTWTPSVPMPP